MSSSTEAMQGRVTYYVDSSLLSPPLRTTWSSIRVPKESHKSFHPEAMPERTIICGLVHNTTKHQLTGTSLIAFIRTAERSLREIEKKLEVSGFPDNVKSQKRNTETRHTRSLIITSVCIKLLEDIVNTLAVTEEGRKCLSQTFTAALLAPNSPIKRYLQSKSLEEYFRRDLPGLRGYSVLFKADPALLNLPPRFRDRQRE
ncbi:hypothetical protein TREMEDRAFT_62197 [Tremella mesenterica DSM 1558]|uniref:uncharacterized protein n=1 Tax=Tremella mesenterica (strain ATCC 24925 / CBS 8224 / DSM 1558 / NBRC 9311 / NRRL Y-6157 / RJB 2259-6 / UBC 559-6) TaxID=578456 RepID=UPI0003F4A337|nr:uncharacterized protein TREMEDRAFT_62197 [Tremella mesenterica DSM 1558]EIW69334.1 hypothetical protein TREMEDRAFT_62197 [Tremella mesenterica DSM 1558]